VLGCAADEADRAGDAGVPSRPRRRRRHIGHLSAGAVAGVHRQEGDLRRSAHIAEALQAATQAGPSFCSGFEIDEVIERARRIGSPAPTRILQVVGRCRRKQHRARCAILRELDLSGALK
jgi:hypothetical protein